MGARRLKELADPFPRDVSLEGDATEYRRKIYGADYDEQHASPLLWVGLVHDGLQVCAFAEGHTCLLEELARCRVRQRPVHGIPASPWGVPVALVVATRDREHFSATQDEAPGTAGPLGRESLRQSEHDPVYTEGHFDDVRLSSTCAAGPGRTKQSEDFRVGRRAAYGRRDRDRGWNPPTS